MPLLFSTLEALRRRLDTIVQGDDPGPEPFVVLSNLVGSDGQDGGATRDKLVLTLAGLHNDAILSAPNTATRKGDVVTPPPPLRLNVILLITANFSDVNYPAGLGLLSGVIGFLQSNPVVTPKTLPGLDPIIDRLAIDFLNLDMAQINSLFGGMGARYMPSVTYRLRALPFVREADEVPLIRETILQRTRKSEDGASETGSRFL